MVLTDGTIPYWTIRQAGHNADADSADEVAKTLERAYSYWALENDSIIIGIFDHDKAGLSAFNGQLKKDDFQTIESNYIKNIRMVTYMESAFQSLVKWDIISINDKTLISSR